MTRIGENAWAPFEPSPDDPWDLRKVAHLHRAAGFGANWAELQRDVAAGPAESVGRFFNPLDPSEDERAVREGLRTGAVGSTDPRRLRAYWLYRMLFGSDPLRERLTLIWHGHFATSLTKVDSVSAMATQVEALRERALGDFAGLLGAMTADPAMLVWLDGGTSKRERPNENYAREFLELFTLGQGAYSELDIREAARAFTGWAPEGGRRTHDNANPRFTFEEEVHDGGSKTILGQTGTWMADDVVRIALERPEAARHLAGKLYRAFVAEEADPEPELIEPLAETLRSSGFSIRRVLEVILQSRHFYSAAAYRRRVKSPVDYTIGLLRMLEVPRPKVSLLATATACGRQGQELFAPPNVKGWEGGKTWINSSTLLERLNWATDVIWGNPDYGMPAFDPVAWADAHRVKPGEAAGRFVNLLLQGDLVHDARDLILAAGRDGDTAGLRKCLQRLLHCPEFQLA
ncbi:Protein of unknown function [Singulisphaera sp. GP187]|uniref:DUF1800 domain-containing protein n=1 Tax=Singulisphaera sp. GP187 TaxID=1882752 RepID=UPI0009283712|nr:DUF1800 domain-containing protein [Singulisphaera sp. GP187]SIO05626.1 Protein of unknown function [Singulisphaera sp. GP187]